MGRRRMRAWRSEVADAWVLRPAAALDRGRPRWVGDAWVRRLGIGRGGGTFGRGSGGERRRDRETGGEKDSKVSNRFCFSLGKMVCKSVMLHVLQFPESSKEMVQV